MQLKSHRALKEFMEYRGFKTAYSLASAAGLKPGVVGHIVAKRRTSCSLKTARALEEALGCPPNFLFEPRLSQVADAPRLKATA